MPGSAALKGVALLLLILLLGFGLRLYGLDHQSLWWDELKTIDRATLSWPDLRADFIATKDQLPFYYLLMRGWILLGQSAFVVRLASVFLGVLNSAGIFQLGKQAGSARAGLIAAFLLAISPFHIWYSQEARMYSLLTGQLILAHIGLIALLRGKSKWFWLGYLVGMGTAVFTHYFTFLILLAHAIYFILHLRQNPALTRQWFGLMTALAAAFIPWILLIGGRTGYNEAVPTWIAPLHWADPLLTFWNFSTGPTFDQPTFWGVLGLLIFSLGLFSFIFRRRAQPTPTQNIVQLLALWAVVPPFLIYAVSLTGAFSLYVDRYLIIILPVFLLCVAWGWARLTAKHPGWLLVFCLLSASVATTGLVKMHSNSAYARNDWGATFTLLASSWQPQDIIIGTRDVVLPLAYYGRSTMPFLEIPPPENDTLTPAFTQAMTARFAAPAASQARRFWLIEPFYVTNPHGWVGERNALVNAAPTTPHHQWLESQFQRLEVWRFPGVRLTLYALYEQS